VTSPLNAFLISRRRVLQSGAALPAVALAGQRDRPLLGVGAAEVVVAELAELAVAVILAGERHAVGAPRDQAAVFHQHRGVPGPGVGIAGEFRRPLHHLFGHRGVLPVQRSPLRLFP